MRKSFTDIINGDDGIFLYYSLIVSSVILLSCYACLA